MRTEHGLRRLVSFGDAVVAIAITLLILPLVDAAGSIDSRGVATFLDDNKLRLFAFVLSFVVIGNFWYKHHQMYEKVAAYDTLLVSAGFLWLLSIVFLPFPTELIGSANKVLTAGHALYIGTMLVTTVAAFLQQWRIVRRPELQVPSARGEITIRSSLIMASLMAAAFVLTMAVPRVGLWSLLLLLLDRPLELLTARRLSRSTTAP
jgi:uncharacterized membrane protein